MQEVYFSDDGVFTEVGEKTGEGNDKGLRSQQRMPTLPWNSD
jgi:hypothetical protein